MISKKGAKLLTGSSGECSYGSTLDPSSTEIKAKGNTESTILPTSASAVSEPSKHSLRSPEPPNPETLEDSNSPINPWRRRATFTVSENLAVPVSSNDQPTDQAGEQQISHEQVEENLGTWLRFIYAYDNAALRVRNSKFIYVLQLLFSIIPISALVLGVMFNGKCGSTEALPAYGGLTGPFGIALTGLWMTISYRQRRGQTCSGMLKLCFLLIFPTFFIFAFVEICVFGTMSHSFDPLSPNYCNETFYSYTFYKQIATVVVAALATMLYLPAALLYFC